LRLRAITMARNSGPAGARNAGWQAATGGVIAFTDDDCMPTPGWLEELLTGLDQADISQGLTAIDPTDHRHIGPFGHTVEVLQETGFYETCNIAYRRDWLECLAGFEESFYYYGEDTDLAWRAKKAGARTVFLPDAVVHHEWKRETDARFFTRRTLWHWRGIARFVRKHPETLARL